MTVGVDLLPAGKAFYSKMERDETWETSSVCRKCIKYYRWHRCQYITVNERAISYSKGHSFSSQISPLSVFSHTREFLELLRVFCIRMYGCSICQLLISICCWATDNPLSIWTLTGLPLSILILTGLPLSIWTLTGPPLPILILTGLPLSIWTLAGIS